MRIAKTTERKFFSPDDPDKSWVMIKHLLPGETQDIFDKAFSHKIEYEKNEKGKMEPKVSQKPNNKLHRELTLQAVVTNWGEFYDKKSNKMKCTPANIVKASREIEGFDEFIDGNRETLADDIAQENKEQLKNLKGSASVPAK